jgi:hypothetical protein
MLDYSLSDYYRVAATAIDKALTAEGLMLFSSFKLPVAEK